MSKASNYSKAKQYAEQVAGPQPPHPWEYKIGYHADLCVLRADVTPDGWCQISVGEERVGPLALFSDVKWKSRTISQYDALRLARWILDTFDSDPNTGSPGGSDE